LKEFFFNEEKKEPVKFSQGLREKILRSAKKIQAIRDLRKTKKKVKRPVSLIQTLFTEEKEEPVSTRMYKGKPVKDSNEPIAPRMYKGRLTLSKPERMTVQDAFFKERHRTGGDYRGDIQAFEKSPFYLNWKDNIRSKLGDVKKENEALVDAVEDFHRSIDYQPVDKKFIDENQPYYDELRKYYPYINPASFRNLVYNFVANYTLKNVGDVKKKLNFFDKKFSTYRYMDNLAKKNPRYPAVKNTELTSKLSRALQQKLKPFSQGLKDKLLSAVGKIQAIRDLRKTKKKVKRPVSLIQTLFPDEKEPVKFSQGLREKILRSAKKIQAIRDLRKTKKKVKRPVSLIQTLFPEKQEETMETLFPEKQEETMETLFPEEQEKEVKRPALSKPKNKRPICSLLKKKPEKERCDFNPLIWKNNSCYMDSVLFSLFNNNVFNNSIQKIKNEPLRNIIQELHSYINSKNEEEPMTCMALKRIFKGIPQLKNYSDSNPDDPIDFMNDLFKTGNLRIMKIRKQEFVPKKEGSNINNMTSKQVKLLNSEVIIKTPFIFCELNENKPVSPVQFMHQCYTTETTLTTYTVIDSNLLAFACVRSERNSRVKAVSSIKLIGSNGRARTLQLKSIIMRENDHYYVLFKCRNTWYKYDDIAEDPIVKLGPRKTLDMDNIERNASILVYRV
jgi:hypothetical protein